MKDQHDNKTVDCFPSMLAVAYGERMILVLGNIIKKRGRTSTDDVKAWLQMSKRSAQRYMNQLEQGGYVESDLETPAGYKATGKAKQIFKIKAVNT